MELTPRCYPGGKLLMEPLISILIPAYNAEAWIADSIRSALNQTWSRPTGCGSLKEATEFG